MRKADQLPENMLFSGFLPDEVEKMLDCLKPEDKELFLKLYVEEKTVGEVSRETGMKADVIYNRISRGRHKIRKKFQAER